MNVFFAYFQVIFMKINEQMGGLAFSETLNFFFKSDQDDYQILKMIYDISLSIIYFENDNKNWAYVAAYIF